jgi:hypothetical protein
MDTSHANIGIPSITQVDAMTDREVLLAVQRIYNATRRQDQHEPSWVAMWWADAFRLDELLAVPEDLSRRQRETRSETVSEVVGQYRSYLKAIARGPHLVTRMLGGTHVQDDGFLIGTTSWIFAGRAKATPVKYQGWTIVSRELSAEVKALERANGLGRGQPTTFWMAYNASDAVGLSGGTGGEIGPCMSIDEVRAYINEEVEAAAS